MFELLDIILVILGMILGYIIRGLMIEDSKKDTSDSNQEEVTIEKEEAE